jgi:hypothetical protein
VAACLLSACLLLLRGSLRTSSHARKLDWQEDELYESCYYLQEVPAVQKVVPPMLQAVQAFIPLGKPLKGNVIGELSGRLAGQVLLSSLLMDLKNFCI